MLRPTSESFGPNNSSLIFIAFRCISSASCARQMNCNCQTRYTPDKKKKSSTRSETHRVSSHALIESPQIPVVLSSLNVSHAKGVHCQFESAQVQMLWLWQKGLLPVRRWRRIQCNLLEDESLNPLRARQHQMLVWQKMIHYVDGSLNVIAAIVR